MKDPDNPGATTEGRAGTGETHQFARGPGGECAAAQSAWPPSRLFFVGSALFVLAVLGAMATFVLAREFALRTQSEVKAKEQAKGRRVLVKRVRTRALAHEVRLPGEVQAFFETPVYAKISGFVEKILVDKGDRVKKGQLIAILSAPELDREIADAKAAYKIAKITNDRYQALVRKGVIPRQTADESEAQFEEARARLQELQAIARYKQVRAPFAGEVTARHVDPGTLVAQSSASASAVSPLTTGEPASPTPLVHLARLDTVRVYTELPQSAAAWVHDGDPAEVTIREYPGRVFKGTVTRHPHALAPATRTMLAEVDLKNPDGTLMPGMYAMVAIRVGSKQSVPVVPDDALIFNNGHVFVPLVRDQRLHLVEVVLGYDDGMAAEVIKGLSGGELVAMNVGQSAREGEPVQPVEAPGPNS